MKTKKLIKDALEFPIIVVTSLWQKAEAMHMYAAAFILQFGLASPTQKTTPGGVGSN
jgi:hypothetical protein